MSVYRTIGPLVFILLVLDDMIEDMADQLKKSHDIEEFSHIALPTQEEVTVVGRICCDSNGKLNAKSVLLEGSVDMSAGKTIPMDLSQLKEYALFPGQVRNEQHYGKISSWREWKTGADQPAHPGSLISTFIHCFDSTIP